MKADAPWMAEACRTLMESIDAGFCVLELVRDAEGKPAECRVVEANSAFERLGTGMADSHWLENCACVLDTGEPMRFVSATQGGWYEIYAVRLGGPGSCRAAALLTDIGERVRAVEALKDAERRKDEFLATLAHELRNPLAPIRNAVSLMRLKSPPVPELQGARDIVDRQVDHLARLIDDLLDLSRMKQNKVELRRERLDLRTVAEEAVATSRPLLEERAHRFTMCLGAEPLWVDADRVRVGQILANLLNNAARYTPPGGEIALEAHAADGEASVCITDNGIGIPSEMLARIFDPFFQIREPRRGLPAGVGIGLSLARMLAELHDGRLAAESEGCDRGSRFTLHLPRLQAREERHRILVVDDNIDAAASQAELLRVMGHDADTAYSGHEAIRKAARYRPDVVLLDLGMPGMDGYEVARHLRGMPEARSAKIIAQTGWGQESDRRRTAEAGFDAHLAKPVDIETLIRTLGRGG
jgi:signal transduction histidine kinase/CheY-like chemotaxis protein